MSTCRGYEESVAHSQEMIRRYCQPEPLSDNETEIDPEEAEDELNNLPSPKQKMSCLWTPEYQARREARRRLWSPPITPPMPGFRDYSLQPSQRPPPPTRRRPSPSRNLPPPSVPPLPSHFQLQLPSKARPNKVRKPRPVPRLHRPTTRSMKSSSLLSLHLRKGLVEITFPAGQSHSVTFKQYQEAGVSWYVPSMLYFLPFPSLWVHLTRPSSKVSDVS
ncbi:MAG: hypothetical protein L6R38_002587 [Xanthoria sp. 2 TBL-2021]|nr:MAG: hypothetical protein L6R38_002587 [Xanthoria sp. 2 TBL-2021]